MFALSGAFGGEFPPLRQAALTRTPPSVTKARPQTSRASVTESTPDSLIPYDEIVQDALRGVVRRVLERIDADGGLPGAHHFYIAFRTRAPGVDIPKHLLERYPEEMTIVIQHRYWDLAIDADGFQIGLSFNQVPAKLRIPFDAVTGFVDPAVNFALQFAPKEGETVLQPEPEPEPPAPIEPGSNVVTLDRFRKK
jgi:hypothetical protein